MLSTRYSYAAEICAAKRVLEIGCGPGLGLGLLESSARSIVGADLDPDLLGTARETYGNRVPLVRLDAQSLPWQDGAFDVVFFFEGSYYVPDMERVFDEVRRVLVPGGLAVFVNANPERPDFIRSPLSVHYHSAQEFRQALSSRGFRVRVDGAFPVELASLRARVLSAVRRRAEQFGLVPRTLAGRALLKRLVAGRLVPLPRELPPGFAPKATKTEIAPGTPAAGWKVIYVTAER